MDRPTCRICGEFGDWEAPLYHPCRCTGSIKYVHEVCLVKWLTIKATGRSGQTQLVADLNETKCELCGFNFQFTPVYSPDFSPRSSWRSLPLMLEILKSLIKRTTRRFLTLFFSLLWTVFAPIVIGGIVVRLVLYWNELPQPFPNLSQTTGSVVLYYIVGMFSMVLGFVTLVFITRIREVPRFPRDLRSAALLVLLAAAAGTSVTVLPYVTGRSFRQIISKICTEKDSFCAEILLYNSPELSPLSQHLSHISIGLVLITIGGLFGILARRLYRAGFSAFMSFLVQIFLNSVRTFVYLIVPLSVGFFFTQNVLATESLVTLSSRLTSFGSLVVHLIIGATIIIPSVLLERFVLSHLVPRPLREDILNRTIICHVIFAGRTQREFASPILAIARESLIRILVHSFMIFFAILPAKIFLNSLNMLPFSTHSDRAETEYHFSFAKFLPIELFYAHVLVPLALNVPRPPRWMRRKFEIFCRKFRYMETLRPLNIPTIFFWLIIRAFIIFVSSIVLIGPPTIAGRLVFGNDDAVSFSVGALLVAGIVNLVVRFFASLEVSGFLGGARTRPRIGSDESIPESATTNPPRISRISNYIKIFKFCLKFFSVFFFAVFIVPICVGIAFHSTIVGPLRFLIADFNVRESPADDQETKSPWILIAPIWIVGMMLIKILIALVSVGNDGIFIPSLRSQIDAITTCYDRNGILSNEFFSAVFRASWTICKNLIAHIFVPEFAGIAAMFSGLISSVTRMFVVDIYLAIRFIFAVIVPGISSVISAEKRAILNEKYLLRTELQNFFLEDSRVAEEGTPGTPLPSIRARRPLVNT